MDNKLEKIMKTQQPCKSCSQLLLNTCSSKNNFDQSQRKCFDAQNSESTDLNAWEPLLCLISKGYFKWVPEQWLIQTHILLPFSLFNTCFFCSLKVKQRSEKWVTEKRNASAMWCSILDLAYWPHHHSYTFRSISTSFQETYKHTFTQTPSVIHATHLHPHHWRWPSVWRSLHLHPRSHQLHRMPVQTLACYRSHHW